MDTNGCRDKTKEEIEAIERFSVSVPQKCECDGCNSPYGRHNGMASGDPEKDYEARDALRWRTLISNPTAVKALTGSSDSAQYLILAVAAEAAAKRRH